MNATITITRPASRLRWPVRPRREQTLTAVRRIWTERLGRYRVVESKSLFGLPTIYYACRASRFGCGWDIVSKHRLRRPAISACERDGRK